jgi:hypothetical protein
MPEFIICPLNRIHVRMVKRGQWRVCRMGEYVFSFRTKSAAMRYAKLIRGPLDKVCGEGYN